MELFSSNTPLSLELDCLIELTIVEFFKTFLKNILIEYNKFDFVDNKD